VIAVTLVAAFVIKRHKGFLASDRTPHHPRTNQEGVMDEANAKTHHVRPITEFPHPRCYKRNEGRVSSESQHSTSAKQSGHERGDARRRTKLYGFHSSVVCCGDLILALAGPGDAQHL